MKALADGGRGHSQDRSPVFGTVMGDVCPFAGAEAQTCRNGRPTSYEDSRPIVAFRFDPVAAKRGGFTRCLVSPKDDNTNNVIEGNSPGAPQPTLDDYSPLLVDFAAASPVNQAEHQPPQDH